MTSPDLVMVVSYDYRLVALSVFIAMLASYAALDLAGRVTSAHGGARLLWLNGGGHSHGNRHLVHALHRHAGFPLADPGAVRLAHGFAIAPGCYSRVCRRLVCREPAQNGIVSSFGRQHLYGWGYRGHALHRHGGHAAGGDVSLFSCARDAFGGSRHRDFFRGFMADILFPGRDYGVGVAEDSQRIGD